MRAIKRIPVAGPWITEREIDYVRDAVENAWYENANVYHERFEAAFAAYTGRKYAMALPSCTSGLHLALLALGIGPGDEVIVPDLTWIASAAPVSYVGATPVFADVDPDSWCLDAAAFEACLTPRTKAVIAVDLYGDMPDFPAILAIAEKRGVAVIEDAAEAIGSEFRGRKAGSFGEAGVFSFHGSKTLTTGEGGMLVTDRAELYEKALFDRDHGRAPGEKLFWNTAVGYKYKMSAMQAALGLAQLERIDELVRRKRWIFEAYRARLADLPGIRLNRETPDVLNTFWMVTVIPDAAPGLSKETLIERLGASGIDARPVFYPLSALPAYAHLPGIERVRARNPVARRLGAVGVNLPSGFNLTEGDIDFVCDNLRALLTDFS
jgi:perosamine synthetase